MLPRRRDPRRPCLASALPDGADPLLPLVLLIGGTVLAVFAAILALAAFLLTRRG